MTLNNTVVISRKGEEVGEIECHVHRKTVTAAVQGGFVYENEIYCRIPLEDAGADVDVKCGDFLKVDDETWKIVGVAVNRDGTNPHVHLIGV